MYSVGNFYKNLAGRPRQIFYRTHQRSGSAKVLEARVRERHSGRGTQCADPMHTNKATQTEE